MDVALVRWPAERLRREQLRATSSLRLLLVEEGAAPPAGGDPFEDWIRMPADEADLAHRLAGVEARAEALRSSPAAPELDADGVLRLDGAWVPLPPVEARLASALIDRLGLVVHRDALAKAGWPDGAPGRNALDVHVLRLRRRLGAVGLGIRTVRSRGYLLERVAPEPSEPRQERVRQA